MTARGINKKFNIHCSHSFRQVKSEGDGLSGSYLLVQGLEVWGLLVLRVALGAAFAIHGYPKIGSRRDDIIDFMRTKGIPGPITMITGYFEFFGGLLMIIGLGVQIIGLLMALESLMTIFVSTRLLKKKYAQGYEIDVAYFAMALALFFLGAGALSVDSYIFSML